VTMKNENQLGAALATVGLTEEQAKAAIAFQERQEKLARWATLAAEAAKEDPTQCCEQVYSSDSYLGHSCCNNAKYHRQEPLQKWPVDPETPTVTRHYCGTHDPVLQKGREDKKRAARRAEWEAQCARSKRIEAEKEALRLRYVALNKLAEGLTTESLERIAKAMPYILSEAINELDGRNSLAKEAEGLASRYVRALKQLGGF